MDNENKGLWMKVIGLVVVALILQALFGQDMGDLLSSVVYYFSVIMTGFVGAIIVGVVTPLLGKLLGVMGQDVSLVWFGLLIGNILFVATIWFFKSRFFKEQKFWGMLLAVIVGSILRVIPVTINANALADISDGVRNALGFPQFATALVGGLIALIIIFILKKMNLASKFNLAPEQKKVNQRV